METTRLTENEKAYKTIKALKYMAIAAIREAANEGRENEFAKKFYTILDMAEDNTPESARIIKAAIDLAQFDIPYVDLD